MTMRQVRAYTLVELLVVIGIIAVLVGILLPVLNRARENGRRVGCASNMRQLAAAFQMYANENRQRFPFAAVGSHSDDPADWIYWQEGRNLADSAIARYLGGGDGISRVFRCPSDDTDSRARIDPDTGAYRYSYAMNQSVASYPINTRPMAALPGTMKLILLIDEDAQTADDGAWNGWMGWTYGYTFELSARHDPTAKPRPNPYDQTVDSRTDQEGRGNVAFGDGHVEQMTRGSIYRSGCWLPVN